MKVKSVFSAWPLARGAKVALLPIVLAMTFGSSPASADTLKPITLTGYSTTRSCTDPNDLQCGSGNEDHTSNVANSSEAQQFSSAQNTVNLGRVTSMSAAGMATTPVGGSTTGELVAKGGGGATLDYQFEVLGPQDISVPVTTLAMLTVSVSGPLGVLGSNHASAQLTISLDGSGIIGQSLLLQNSAPQTESVSINQTNMLETNTAYDVHMAIVAYSSIDTFTGIDTGTDLTNLSASASIDPSFQLGLDAPSGYSIDFSEGIGDTPSATPLPGALPLFASGLGVVGLFVRRNKRKAAALEAWEI